MIEQVEEDVLFSYMALENRDIFSIESQIDDFAWVVRSSTGHTASWSKSSPEILLEGHHLFGKSAFISIDSSLIAWVLWYMDDTHDS